MTLAPDDPLHGTYAGYRNHGCRCAPCRAANADYSRANRNRRGYTTRNHIDSTDAYISTGLAAITFEHPAWMATGECNGLDPNLFHPERGESSHHAKAVCAGCAQRELCADYAIEHRIAVGIWGGTSGRERRRLIAANVLALVPTLPSPACGEPEGPETTENADNAVYGTEVA